jgi:hypothetical protein
MPILRNKPVTYLRRSRLIGLGLAGLVSLGWLWGQPIASAQQLEPMKSASYVIDFGNFNMTSGTKTGGGYKVTDTVGQTAPGYYSGTGYKVFAGFQYIYALPRFSFRITSLNIDFGVLSLNNFATGTNQLIISTRSGGYSILAQADHQLRLTAGTATIPATNCDAGCSVSAAGQWVDGMNNGFGFNAYGTHVNSDFTNPQFFRPFADASLAQPAEEIAHFNQVVTNDTATITYQVSINSGQAGGIYQTGISYTAVPTY